MKKLMILLTLISLFSCQKDDDPKLKSRVLFSVDIDAQQFQLNDKYLAAYTSDGELLNYGSITDSSKWELKGEYKEDKIDVLFFSISNYKDLSVEHIKNVSIGESFKYTKKSDPNPIIAITLKVEDFGNHNRNNTGTEPIEYDPLTFKRGSSYSGEFSWEKIEDGYAYTDYFVDSDPTPHGNALVLFERVTNKPYAYYIDMSTSNLNPNDTITLNKSDFTACELKKIPFDISNSDFNMTLITYNAIDGKEDLITSHDRFSHHFSTERCMNYIYSDILPFTHWELAYYETAIFPPSSYEIKTNREIPSSIEITKLNGHKMTKSGNQFNFTHSNNFPDKNLASSTIWFEKTDFSRYILHFDGSESMGSTTITPFEIPHGILAKDVELLESDSLEWYGYRYYQTYTNIPNNSPLDAFKDQYLRPMEQISSENDFIYEVYTILL